MAALHPPPQDASLQVKRARAKQLKPDEYTTGTFTISNLGMFGVDSFDAILPAGGAHTHSRLPPLRPTPPLWEGQGAHTAHQQGSMQIVRGATSPAAAPHRDERRRGGRPHCAAGCTLPRQGSLPGRGGGVALKLGTPALGMYALGGWCAV